MYLPVTPSKVHKELVGRGCSSVQPATPAPCYGADWVLEGTATCKPFSRAQTLQHWQLCPMLHPALNKSIPFARSDQGLICDEASS